MYLTPLFEDDDVVAVVKPPGLLTHPADVDSIADSATDAVRRASEHTHLGVHQRLDRDTSGILLFGCSADADRGLARSFGGHEATKTYNAVVHGRPRQASGTIELHLSPPGPEGRVSVVRGQGGKEAITRYRVVATDWRSDISVIEAQPLTGRTHQVRAHLAALGCPVVGDGLYDTLQRPAPRLCLHATALSLPHPVRHEQLDLHAAPPVELAELPRAVAVLGLTRQLMEAGASAATLARAGAPGLRDLLTLAIGRREALDADQAVTAYRLLNGDGDGLPGITVDRFGDLLTVNYYDDDARPDAPSSVVDHLIELLDPRLVHVRVRPRHAGTATDNGTFRRGPAEADRTGGEVVVADDGLSYLVRPDVGVNSGLFLDMRELRAWIRRHATGQSVLNLFSYTCAFGVAALAGGATRVLNLDAGRPALQWGKENYQLNNLPVDDHDFVEGDVFDWLNRFARRKQMFDMVIADPPSFATTETSRFAARRDYRNLAAQAAAVVAPRGLLIACCNLASLSGAEFRRSVRMGIHDTGRDATLIATGGEPGVDFPRTLDAEGYLKIAILRIA